MVLVIWVDVIRVFDGMAVSERCKGSDRRHTLEKPNWQDPNGSLVVVLN